jgi:hypothetical protein
MRTMHLWLIERRDEISEFGFLMKKALFQASPTAPKRRVANAK